MRLGGSTVMLALLLGAVPALAQESPGIMPTPTQPDRDRSTKREDRQARHAASRRRQDRRAGNGRCKNRRVEADQLEPEPADADVRRISDSERLKIQSALLWSGDYTGSIGGEDPFLSAIKNFQKRAKTKITGILSPAERANLLAAAKTHEDEFGWTIVTDPATGVRLGLPAKLVPQVRDAARGTRWSSAHGEVQVETFRIKDPELKLAALFEQQKKEPATRKVESSVLRDDNFFISGMQGLKKFSVRAICA